MKLIHGLITATLAVVLFVPAAWAQAVPTTTAPIVPLQLKPTSTAPITLHMVDDSKAIYQAIGKSAGSMLCSIPTTSESMLRSI